MKKIKLNLFLSLLVFALMGALCPQPEIAPEIPSQPLAIEESPRAQVAHEPIQNGSQEQNKAKWHFDYSAATKSLESYLYRTYGPLRGSPAPVPEQPRANTLREPTALSVYHSNDAPLLRCEKPVLPAEETAVGMPCYGENYSRRDDFSEPQNGTECVNPHYEQDVTFNDSLRNKNTQPQGDHSDSTVGYENKTEDIVSEKVFLRPVVNPAPPAGIDPENSKSPSRESSVSVTEESLFNRAYNWLNSWFVVPETQKETSLRFYKVNGVRKGYVLANCTYVDNDEQEYTELPERMFRHPHDRIYVNETKYCDRASLQLPRRLETKCASTEEEVDFETLSDGPFYYIKCVWRPYIDPPVLNEYKSQEICKESGCFDWNNKDWADQNLNFDKPAACAYQKKGLVTSEFNGREAKVREDTFFFRHRKTENDPVNQYVCRVEYEQINFGN